MPATFVLVADGEGRGLTKREAQIARLLARRATNREIAEQLDLSPHTVRHHAENIFAKLGVHAPLDPRAVRVTA